MTLLNARFVQCAEATLKSYREFGEARASGKGREYVFAPLVSDFVYDKMKDYLRRNKMPNCLPPKKPLPSYSGPSFEDLLLTVPGIFTTTVKRTKNKVTKTLVAFIYH
jgi:hypothetical protein